MSYNDFDLDRVRELREKAKSSFVRQFRRDLAATALISAPFVALICFASMKLALSTELQSYTLYSMLYLLGLLLIALAWAVHGLGARLLFLSKELKQLRLDFLVAHEASPEQATGGAETFFSWMTGAVRPRSLVLVFVTLFVLVPVVTAIVYRATNASAQQAEQWEKRTYDNSIYEHWRGHAFGGQESVEVHFTQEGVVRVFSRVEITKLPAHATPIPIRISQPGATVESVVLGGRQLAVVPVPVLKDTYSVMPGSPEQALKGATLEVVWSIPMAAMGFDEDRFGCNFRHLGILPVSAYTAKVVIDDGVPYTLEFADPGSREYTMFSRPNLDYEAGELGYSGILLHYAAPKE